VIAECGEPTTSEITSEQTIGSYGERTLNRGRGRAHTSGSYSQETQVVERWTFNCGDGDYRYVLIFVGGALSTIESAGRGSGPSDCRGAGLRSEPTSAPGPPTTIPPTPDSRRQAYGTVSVFGQPYHAEVYLDGSYAGEITCTIEGVTPGDHVITVKEEGFKVWKTRILVEPEKVTHVEVYLKPK
jgi:hypothetical protein